MDSLNERASGPFALLPGSACPTLAHAVAEHLGVGLHPATVARFPDGELHVAVGPSVRGRDVFLLQSTAPNVEPHLLELLLLADAVRRSGAARVTAVIPYFGYARQDRRTNDGEAVGARVVADMLHGAGIERIVSVDLHSPTLEGVFSDPLDHVSAVTELAAALGDVPDGVIVAPDLGAARLADRYADLLDLPTAVVHKTRLSGERVRVRRLTGEVAGRTPIIVDDMISTGATVEAAIAGARDAGAKAGAVVAATHGLLVGNAPARLERLHLARLVVTDTVEMPAGPGLPLHVRSVAPILAAAIRRLATA